MNKLLPFTKLQFYKYQVKFAQNAKSVYSNFNSTPKLPFKKVQNNDELNKLKKDPLSKFAQAKNTNIQEKLNIKTLEHEKIHINPTDDKDKQKASNKDILPSDKSV